MVSTLVMILNRGVGALPILGAGDAAIRVVWISSQCALPSPLYMLWYAKTTDMTGIFRKIGKIVKIVTTVITGSLMASEAFDPPPPP